MTDPGLDNRLRQYSRRAGLLVGLSMALTIAICIGGAAAIYAVLVPIFSDLVPISAAPRGAQVVATQAPEGGTEPQGNGDDGPAVVAPPAPTAAPAPTPTPEPTDAFEPTHQISSSQSINFRAGPSTNDQILLALSPATPLEATGERAPTANPAQDGNFWLQFTIEDGTEGWVREIDTEPYQP